MFRIFPSTFEKFHNSKLVLNSMKIENNVKPLFTQKDIGFGLFISKNDRIYECPICLTFRRNLCYSKTCKHIFCINCIHEWKKYSQKCPLCRRKIRKICLFPISF